jgi:phage baseplate assembly protein gpV
MQMSGAYRGIVVDTRDPANRDRIKVILPAITGDSISEWIPPMVSAGYVVIPSPGEQVWVLFEAGDVNLPLWLGSTKSLESYDNLLVRLENLESQMTAVQAYIDAHP